MEKKLKEEVNSKVEIRKKAAQSSNKNVTERPTTTKVIGTTTYSTKRGYPVKNDAGAFAGPCSSSAGPSTSGNQGIVAIGLQQDTQNLENKFQKGIKCLRRGSLTHEKEASQGAGESSQGDLHKAHSSPLSAAQKLKIPNVPKLALELVSGPAPQPTPRPASKPVPEPAQESVPKAAKRKRFVRKNVRARAALRFEDERSSCSVDFPGGSETSSQDSNYADESKDSG